MYLMLVNFQALHSLHAVYVEGGGASGSGNGGSAVAAVRSELTAALRWARALCRTLRTRRDNKEARALLLACKDWPECARRLLTMLHLHHRLDRLRNAALGKYLYKVSPDMYTIPKGGDSTHENNEKKI